MTGIFGITIAQPLFYPSHLNTRPSVEQAVDAFTLPFHVETVDIFRQHDLLNLSDGSTEFFNLDNSEYLEIMLDGCNPLEERFEKIDSRLVIEKLQAEKENDKSISPVVKKIIRHLDLPARLTHLLNNSNIDTNRHLLS